tara:strand:+ start:2068 stop:2799 length:732 start_codon:yes stop_codon:yes gene_type:complete
MNINEMHSWFDILQMKGHNREFTRREKDHLINRAQIKYANEVLQKKYLPSVQAGEKAEMVFSSAESIIAGHDSISPLLGSVNVTSNQNAIFTFTNIESQINTKLITALNLKPTSFTSKLMMILGIQHTNNEPCRYLSLHDRRKNNNNIYRKATEFAPTYSIEEHRVNVEPNSLGNDSFTVFYIREPDPVKWDYKSSLRVDCELPDFTHDEIISIALDDAGLAHRDDALMQLNKANKENLSENF